MAPLLLVHSRRQFVCFRNKAPFSEECIFYRTEQKFCPMFLPLFSVPQKKTSPIPALGRSAGKMSLFASEPLVNPSQGAASSQFRNNRQPKPPLRQLVPSCRAQGKSRAATAESSAFTSAVFYVAAAFSVFPKYLVLRCTCYL